MAHSLAVAGFHFVLLPLTMEKEINVLVTDNMQSWLYWGLCPLGCVPIYGWAVVKPGQLYGQPGPEQAQHRDPQEPHQAWHPHQLGQHGEDLAPHILQAVSGP